MDVIIESHFQDKDLDIRKKYQGYSRFMDQKVTPDVLAFITDCILNLPDRTRFTVKDIWKSDYFEQNAKEVFGKPSPSDETASSEYDKFIAQPLKTLSYAQVISVTKVGNTNYYTISNQGLLEYISLNDRWAFNFLYEYIVKVLSDSGFLFHFQNYQKEPNPTNFDNLKTHFQRFMIGNTKIQGKIEVNRIFPKVLNSFAVRNNLPGSKSGRITKHPFTYSDLMYNRTNFRDTKKPKGVSRQESAIYKGAPFSVDSTQYAISKAKRIIQKKYLDSEVKDQWARGEATQVHHIFPRSQYPQYAAYTENLIKLTPEQHNNHAHPSGRTNTINRDYQIQCLLSKCDSIEHSINSGEFIYSKESFIHIINTCLNLNINAESNFPEIREALHNFQANA